jgi:hypothetical protein
MSDRSGAPLTRRLASPGVIGGALALAIGVWAMAEAWTYPLGTLRRMGPGYFPVMLGGLMAAMGAMLALSALVRAEPPVEDDERPNPRALVAVLAGSGGIRAAAAARRAGAGGGGAGGDRGAGIGADAALGTLALAAFLAALSWAIFRLGLGLQLPAFRF